MTPRIMFLFAFALAAMLTFAGCQTAPPPQPKMDLAAAARAINALADQCAAAMNFSDAAAVAASYADDAIEMPPDQAAIEGKQAIQASYEAIFKEYAVKFALTPLETQLAGDWAYQRGNYTDTVSPKSGKPMQQSGKYLVSAKRQPDGSWEGYRATCSSNDPPPAVAGKKK